MSVDVWTAICCLLMANVGQGSTVSSSVCDSYRAIQQLPCLEMRAPTPKERERLFSGDYLTKEGVEVFLGVWCSSLLRYDSCISTNTEQCPNRVELQQLGQENGGLCTANGEIDQQVQPYLQMLVQAAIMGECAQYWRRFFGPCYPRGGSEMPDRPDSSMTIALGKAWWTRTRTDTIRCIVNKVVPTPPDSCVGMSARDAKIFAVLDTLWSEPYGVGAHVDISGFIDQI
ncbi:uncharacterized protein LOC110448292 isoform X1 [Mizuhopecten yessoensis]|uniref:uncharacterized protein LOC110448292 isoform X1 n=1 Tax=Mizuhopecten yessoensis TaxID=6573 RepID=UPI000B45D1F4|nr:uncharacterized protein LOC110448292 isoform X1 [Mizuhopecten yessoensis]